MLGTEGRSSSDEAAEVVAVTSLVGGKRKLATATGSGRGHGKGGWTRWSRRLITGPVMTEPEAIAIAASEGLELARAQCTTGFRGVRCKASKETVGGASRYEVLMQFDGEKTSGGRLFSSAAEAALCFARLHAAAAAQRLEPPKLSEAEVLRMAEAEGLELVRSTKNPTGYRGVDTQPAQQRDFATHTCKTPDKCWTCKPFRVERPGHFTAPGEPNHGERWLGAFSTPWEAALCYTRHCEVRRQARAEAERATQEEEQRAKEARREAERRAAAALQEQASLSIFAEAAIIRDSTGAAEAAEAVANQQAAAEAAEDDEVRRQTTSRCNVCRGGQGLCTLPGKGGHLSRREAHCLACSGMSVHHGKYPERRVACQKPGRRPKARSNGPSVRHWPAPPAPLVALQVEPGLPDVDGCAVLLGLNAAEIEHYDYGQLKQAEVLHHYSMLVQEQAYRGQLPVTRHAQSRQFEWVGRHIDGRHNGMGVARQRNAYGKGATLQGGISIVRRVLIQARDEHMSAEDIMASWPVLAE